METAIPGASLSRRPEARAKLYLLWPTGAVLLATLSSISSYDITLAEFLYAAVLLAISIQAYISWSRARNIKVPVWALICLAHFVFYGIAIFEAERRSPSLLDRRDLPDSVLTTAMLVGIIGLLSMGAGRIAAMHLTRRKAFRPRLIEMSTPTPARIQVLLIIGTAANVFGIPFFGTAVWNISTTAFSVLPLIAFLWLVLVRRVRGLSQFDWLLAVAYLSTRVTLGARSYASLGTIIAPLLLIVVCDVSQRRKLPWPMIAAVVGLIVFLQPGKGTIRHEMSRGKLADGLTDAAVRWVEVSIEGWTDVLEGRSTLEEQLISTSSRSSLLTMTGLILEKTPELVPYQFGASYPLLIENLIPRVVWPDKPSVNVANQFFQVQYGLTAEQDLSSVSIACGFEPEGYMNFGWAGIVAVGLIVGSVLGIYELTFFSAESNLSAIAVGLVMLPGFLSIESQLVQYLGGILQIAFAAGLVFYQPQGKRSANEVRGGPTRKNSFLTIKV